MMASRSHRLIEAYLVSALLTAVGSCSDEHGTSQDSGVLDPRNRFESIANFPRGGCQTGSLKDFDPVGRWRVDRGDGDEAVNASYYLDEAGSLTALLALAPVTTFEFTDDDLFARQQQGRAILAVNLCAKIDAENLSGYLGECLDDACEQTTVTATLVGPITE